MCGGGGGGETIDKEYNAGMLKLSQEEMGYAREMYNMFKYGVEYDPNETVRGAYVDGNWVNEADLPTITKNKEIDFLGRTHVTGTYEETDPQYQIETKSAGDAYGYNDDSTTSQMEYLQNVVEANQGLLGLRTEAETSNLNLATTRNRAAEGLVPMETEAAESGLSLATTRNRAKESLIPQTTELASGLISDASKGLDVGKEQDLAQAGVQHSFKNARKSIADNVSSYGLDPGSGMFNSQNRDMALAESAAVVGARTKAKRDTEDVNFTRKQQALQTMNY